MTRMENINDFGTMRYWNLTYNDPGRWAEVHAISGAPLNFFQSIKAGGTGSPRAVLVKSGISELDELLAATSVIKYCNFERTANGMVMYVRVRLEVYGIPFRNYDLLRVEGLLARGNVGFGVRLVLRDGGEVELEVKQEHQKKLMAWLNRAVQG